MKVKSVINKCKELLEIDADNDGLLRCYNFAEQEMALDHFPLYAMHQCDSKKVYYSDLEYHAVRIVKCNCPFKLYPEYMKAKENIKEIVYTYIPPEKYLYDDCVYGEEFFDCLVYGTISEYLISRGFYEESIRWTKKYRDVIKLLATEEIV